jgi:hypothetical protein
MNLMMKRMMKMKVIKMDYLIKIKNLRIAYLKEIIT